MKFHYMIFPCDRNLTESIDTINFCLGVKFENLAYYSTCYYLAEEFDKVFFNYGFTTFMSIKKYILV